ARPRLVHAAAEEEEVLRDRAAADLPHASLEAQVGDVVLPAAVRAAAHLDREFLGAVGTGGAKVLGEERREAARARDREAAALRARAARDVGDRVSAVEREARRDETRMERGNVLLANPPQEEVLRGCRPRG